MTKNYVVEGMTCEHCISAVTDEITEVKGTQGVDVDLATGNVAVTGEGFSDEAIVAAVAEAGYKVRD
ncbi:Copper chaperone CopZ [Corynebacterium occultum]|uniref:Copper chaperone CopZ n=1 Tax=Corynebacterium occultum TaxID=2675219 RepID=A0A6B8WCJ1_9CORY|nr:heavy-metal-associated domain-containing protein [Corynebacterium occultum]QGU08606.1 Copper chaperone CopZ [Corynebacterium occultum]